MNTENANGACYAASPCWAGVNHYKWLEQYLPAFFAGLGLDYCSGLITAHGDKCYSYRMKWEKNGIPFPHGVAVCLLSYIQPYAKEVRETANGWVAPADWVVANYCRFSHLLPTAEISGPANQPAKSETTVAMAELEKNQ